MEAASSIARVPFGAGRRMTGLYQRRPGGPWWVRYSDHGKKIRESSGSTNRQVALALLRKRQAEIATTGRALGHVVERVLVDELLADLQAEYRIQRRPSVRTLNGQVKALLVHLQGVRAVNVTTTRLRAMVEAWQAEGVAPATINKRLTSLRRAMNLGRQATPPNVLTVPVFPRLAEHNAREGFFEKVEFLELLRHLSDDDVRDFVVWAYWTGMRRGEIAKLEWAGFDRETWTLVLPGRITKNRRPRKLALVGPLREIFERRLARRRLDCWLVFHRGGRPVGSFRKAWLRACRLAGVEGRLFHDLRRTGVRNLRRAGVDRKVAMMISEHKTEAVFERYNIDTDDDLREAVERMAAYVEALPAEPKVRPLAIGS